MSEVAGWKERIMDIGERRVTEWVNQVLSAKNWRATKGGLKEGSIELRKRAEELILFLFSSLDLPTRKDLDDFNRRLEILNGKVVSLTLKVEKILEEEQ